MLYARDFSSLFQNLGNNWVCMCSSPLSSQYWSLQYCLLIEKRINDYSGIQAILLDRGRDVMDPPWVVIRDEFQFNSIQFNSRGMNSWFQLLVSLPMVLWYISPYESDHLTSNLLSHFKRSTKIDLLRIFLAGN